MKVRTANLGCVALVLVTGCCSRPGADPKRPEARRQRTAIEDRAALIFTNAILLKPREIIPAPDLAFPFAPLLIQEITGIDAGSDGGPTTVFYQLGAVQIAKDTRLQWTYLWAGGNEHKMARGVRLTLNARGMPVIWEVLDDRPGARVVFVSQSLEETARAVFGSPWPDRRFAVEQPTRVAPDIVVARKIEDGPEAMGPIVHQTAGREINSVICRCMSPQARQLLATRYYELKPLSAAPNVAIGILETNRHLTEKLRLPPTF